jgi:putative ABC transport system substrate-binding protein
MIFPEKIRHHLFFWLLLLWLLPGMEIDHAWADSSIVVLYPEVREPYFSVFQTILKGIESKKDASIKTYTLPENFDSGRVTDWLDKQNADAVIGLGKQGLKAVESLKDTLPVVIGALMLPPIGLSGVSLAADPDELFSHLKSLAPRVKRVFVVYNPHENAWLINLAREAARAHGLELICFAADDLREAVHHYRDLLKSTESGRDAIWLPPDDISANDKVVLPLLLEASWAKNFILFSSKPAHAKRGVLFSLYPDNFALGQRLVEMAVRLHKNPVRPQVIPLQDVQVAVNLRTAAHLGLNYTSRQKRNFDLTFPAR